MRAFGYVRVSTSEQADSGISLTAQRAKIEGYARLYDLELVEVIADAGWSAKSLERPGVRALLARLKAGEAEGVVVARLDRLTRRVADLGALLEGPFAKAALMSVAEQLDARSAGGRLMIHILASVAEWERSTIAERVSTALQQLKSQGRRVGAVPFGYALADDGRHLVPLPDEQVVIAEAKRLREAGLSLRQVAKGLVSAGKLSRTGKKWAPMQVKRMLRYAA